MTAGAAAVDDTLAIASQCLIELWAEAQAQLTWLRTIHASLAQDGSASTASVLAQKEGNLANGLTEVIRHVVPRRVASLLVGMTATAQDLGIELAFDGRPGLRRIPTGLSETEVVSILGNLMQNAIDTAADVAPHRRKVRVSLSDADGTMRVWVRDWGAGIGGHLTDLLVTRGFSTKPGHHGIGLAIVQGLVERAGGSLTIRCLPEGTAVSVIVADA